MQGLHDAHACAQCQRRLNTCGSTTTHELWPSDMGSERAGDGWLAAISNMAAAPLTDSTFGKITVQRQEQVLGSSLR